MTSLHNLRVDLGVGTLIRRCAPILLTSAVLLASARSSASATDPRPKPRSGGEVSAAAGDAPTSFNRPFFAGVYLGDSDSRTDRIGAAIDRFSRMVGKRPALVKTFNRLDDDFSPNGWAGQLVRRVADVGSTSYIALDLRWSGSPRGAVLDAINAGRADAALARAARQMASLRTTILIEPGWEMNGRWNNYAWQGVANGNAAAPAKYRTAFQRMVNIFRREGARNVKWVFAPNVGNAFTLSATGPSHWNWYGNYYPGDAYVDYLGPHGYNGSTVWGGSYQDFGTLFDGRDADYILSDLERRYPHKPIIIGEYASDEVRGRDKGRWIAEAYTMMRRHRNVVGAVWFNMRKEADWRIDSSRSALEAYRTAMRDPAIRSDFR